MGADRTRPLALKARYVFPIAAPPLADAMVTLSGDRIKNVGTQAVDCELLELGNAAIVPGFVNAHAHLEFSDLAEPIGEPGTPITDWIRLVLARRREATGPLEARIARGLDECAVGGTTAVGEIATQDWRIQGGVDPERQPAVVMFHESIGPTAERVESARWAAESFLTANTQSPAIRLGLSPHAPYTVRPQLLESLVDLSRQHAVPMALHLAESREELELLATGGGPFRALLEDVGAWDAHPAARYPAVLDYLRQLARAPRSLVIHGNYLSAVERSFLAAHAGTMSVVYCPRTHQFFGHEPYPLAEMLAQGVSAAVGTDGRSSSPDLSLIDELRLIGQLHPQIAPAKVLELGTLAGARALGVENEMGTLEPGKLANFAVIRLPDVDTGDPHELVFDARARVMETWIAGRRI